MCIFKYNPWQLDLSWRSNWIIFTTQTRITSSNRMDLTMPSSKNKNNVRPWELLRETLKSWSLESFHHLGLGVCVCMECNPFSFKWYHLWASMRGFEFCPAEVFSYFKNNLCASCFKTYTAKSLNSSFCGSKLMLSTEKYLTSDDLLQHNNHYKNLNEV